MLLALAQLMVVAYLPGALAFRLPTANRLRRAALPADERVFWAVVLSVTITTLVTLGLASAGAYTFGRLLAADAGISALLLLAGRGNLRLGTPAPKPQWTALVPVALVGLGMSLFFPSSEYVMGGKDPGTYMNEGIQIAQRGSLRIADDTLAALPNQFRGLYLTEGFDWFTEGLYEGVRFMGFFVTNRARGEVIGQFPHAFPAWIAIGYGVDGLSGARRAVGFWALLGLVAFYFAGARLVGRLPAAAGCVLLAINVAEVWYARYPNSEVMQQALLFAALLALGRAYQDEDPFFEPVAGLLLGALLFVRFDAVLVLAYVSAGLLLVTADGKRVRWTFWLPLAAQAIIAAAYYAGPMKMYVAIPLLQLGGWRMLCGGAAAVVVALFVVRHIRSRRPAIVQRAQSWIPRVMAAAIALCAVYAGFLREPVGKLAAHDAFALPVFAWYVGGVGLASAVVGFGLLSWRHFWRAPILLTVTALASMFLFYKIRIVPEHFWQARRYIPLVLPMTCLFMASVALSGFLPGLRASTHGAGLGARLLAGAWRIVLPVVLLGATGWSFAVATRPILHHVEYAGLIPQLEQLASRIGERDLLVVEPRNSSDVHVLATPLAYIYAKHVLLLSTPKPNRATFAQFMTWATHTYTRVLFVADGGTDLASATLMATPLTHQRFQIAEYESLRNAYPRSVRQKKFGLNLYRLSVAPRAPVVTDLDVGAFDDLWVYRINAKEETDGVNYRWTRDVSYVTLQGVGASARVVRLWMSNGGRPEAAGPARVRVMFNDHLLGEVVVGGGFHAYQVAVPPEVAAEASRLPDVSVIRLICTTWTPSVVFGGSDDRALGVMLDRVRLE